MAKPWGKREVKRLRAALRVLREDAPDLYEDLCDAYAITICDLFMEPTHAIKSYDAASLMEEAESMIAEFVEQ